MSDDGKGFVRIERGPLRFTVLIDKPLTREQLVGLEPIARAMEQAEALFRVSTEETTSVRAEPVESNRTSGTEETSDEEDEQPLHDHPSWHFTIPEHGYVWCIDCRRTVWQAESWIAAEETSDE